MRRHLKNKNIANTFWNLLDIFLYPVLFFTSVPFFIRQLGTETFGIWMLLNTILVGMQVFNFGLGPGILKNIAWQIGKKDKKAEVDIVNNGLSMSLFLLGTAVLITAVLAILIRTVDLFSIHSGIRSQAVICVALTGGMVGFRFIEQVFTNFHKAHEDYKTAAMIAISNRALPLLINLVLLYTYPRISALVLSILATNALVAVVCLFQLKKKLPGYRFRFKVHFTSETSRFAFVLWLQSLCMIGIFQADRYLIIQYFGLVTLSFYALTATIFNHIHMGFNAILGWVAPKFTKLKARDEEVKDLYTASRDGVLLISVNALLIFHFLYPYLFPLVLGAENTAAMRPYIDYFIMLELFLVPSIIPAYFLNASGHERGYLLFLVLFAVGTIGGMFVALQFWKAPLAVLLALVAGNFAGMQVQNLFAEKQLFTKSEMLRQLPRWWLLPVAACLFLLFPDRWWGLLALAAVWVYSIFIFLSSGKAHVRLLYRA